MRFKEACKVHEDKNKSAVPINIGSSARCSGVDPALGKWKWESQASKASLYILSWKPAWATWDLISKVKQNKQKPQRKDTGNNMLLALWSELVNTNLKVESPSEPGLVGKALSWGDLQIPQFPNPANFCLHSSSQQQGAASLETFLSFWLQF